MGNICCCCIKRSNTPYDPFIYDQEYEEYYDPNPLDPRLLNTYNPPTVIQLDHTNYGESLNNTSSSVINVNEYYNPRSSQYQPTQQQQRMYSVDNNDNNINAQPQQPRTSFIKSPIMQQQQDPRYMTSSFGDLHKGYQNQNSSQQQHQQQSSPQPQHQPQQPPLTTVNNNNNQINNNQTYKPFQESDEEDSDLYEKDEPHIQQPPPQQQPQQPIQTADQFYSHYTNFTESHYDINPPTNDLGITDSIMDSIVLGVNNNNNNDNINNINKFNNFSNNSNNNSNNNLNTTTTTTTTTTSSPNVNNSNIFNSPNSSVNSSTNITDTDASIYYDAPGSFSQNN